MPNFMPEPLCYWSVVRRSRGEKSSRAGACRRPLRARDGVAFAAILIGTAVLLCPATRAAPPERPDPTLAPWFNSLRQPWTNALCCSLADCRPVDSRTAGDHYEALIEGEWHAVPEHRIVNRSDNPTGRAV